jgi:hypothetical protein
MPLIGANGRRTRDDDDETPELPPIRSFAVQTMDDKAVTLRAHSYDLPGDSLVFAEFIDIGDGKAAIVVVDAFAPGTWKRFKEVPGPVENDSTLTN